MCTLMDAPMVCGHSWHDSQRLRFTAGGLSTRLGSLDVHSAFQCFLFAKSGELALESRRRIEFSQLSDEELLDSVEGQVLALAKAVITILQEV